MRNSGFTIIELMIVIAIIAILAAVGGPAMMNWRGDTALRSAHMNLSSDLRMARLRAIKDRAPVTVRFTQTGYQIFLDDGVDNGGNITINRGNGVRDNPEPLLKGVTLDPPITISSTNDINGWLSFDVRGFPVHAIPGTTPSVASGDVTVGNGNQDRVINISLIGRITTP